MAVTEILAAKTDFESVYYRLNPENGNDGRVQRGDASMDVPFWSYVSREIVTPITTTLFHKNLWRRDFQDKEWVEKYYDHQTPFDDDELRSIGIEVPEEEESEKKSITMDEAARRHNAFAEVRSLRGMSMNGKRVPLEDISIKVGIVQSNNPIVRAGQTAASFAIPGDLSDIRKPVRSTIYETLTPGGTGIGRPRNLLRRGLGRGERNQLRCPAGFENGGRFARKDLSNCGLQIFDLPGFGLVTIGALPGRRNRRGNPLEGEGVARGDAPGDTTTIRQAATPAPQEGVSIQSTAPVASQSTDISRVALISMTGELNAAKRDAAIKKAIPVAVKANNPDFGRLVRRDGTMLDNVVPLVRLADVRNSDDMDQGFLVTSITDPKKFAVDEFQVFSAGLDGIVMATPDGKGYIRLEKTGRGSIRGMRRRWGTILREQEDALPGVAFDQLAQEGGTKLKLSIQYPGITNPLDMVEIERGGAKRSVRKWVYVMFLSSEAPMRPKDTKPWLAVKGSKK